MPTTDTINTDTINTDTINTDTINTDTINTDTINTDPQASLVTDPCGFFDAPHAHLWEYTNGHWVCAFCDGKRPFTA